MDNIDDARNIDASAQCPSSHNPPATCLTPLPEKLVLTSGSGFVERTAKSLSDLFTLYVAANIDNST
jgi:hypothetical protein